MTALPRAFACALFTCGLLAASAGDASAANANPALWRIESETGRVYLFGSYHVLPKSVVWWTTPLVNAMAQSGAFVFEAELGEESMAEAQRFIDSTGYLPEGQKLSSLLSPELQDSYREILRALPLDEQKMDRQRPWLAALTLTSSSNQSRQYSVMNGADVRVLAYARTKRKPVSYFETPRQQLEYLADASKETEVASFEALVASFDERPAYIRRGIEAWVDGDVDELSMRLHRGLRNNPYGKKVLLDDRNVAWAAKVADLLKENRTYFITVGIGHLGGPNNMVGHLCKQGFDVVRVKTSALAVPEACAAAEAANSLE